MPSPLQESNEVKKTVNPIILKLQAKKKKQAAKAAKTSSAKETTQEESIELE